MPLVARRRGVGFDSPFEWATLALATYEASRMVAREQIGDFIREPLESRSQEGDGWSTAVTELVTCTRCVGVWSAVGLSWMRVLAPGQARLAIDVLSIAGANNFLQAGFARLTGHLDAASIGAPDPNLEEPKADSGGASQPSRTTSRGALSSRSPL